MPSRTDLRLRHSVAPRVLNGSLATRGLTSNAHLSVRAAPPVSPNAPILTTFVWKQGGARLYLAGSFDDWRKHEMTYVPDANSHVLVVEVPPGEYFYRFVVDGCWRVADGAPDLREDMFGEMSHFIAISADSVAAGSASVARTDLISGSPVIDEGASDTDGDDGSVVQKENEDMDEAENRKSIPLPPRQRGNGFVEDYDDDANGEFDLQVDVLEAIKDIAEKTTEGAPISPIKQSATSGRPGRRKKPGRRMMARVFALLFAQPLEPEPEELPPPPPSKNQRMHAAAVQKTQGKPRGLRVWFTSEKKEYEEAASKGRKLTEEEKNAVIDPHDTAMRLHQVEENAQNRQLLGKTLFAQGKYDAALALFSLSVKLREDNGLRNAKTNAVAHTDVASAFIHLDDLKNAEKHLRVALDIFSRATFSGGRVQLGDVHCFLGVVADMNGSLKQAELSYRNAIDLYEKSRATESNPNYETAIDNLSANTKRQKQAEMDGTMVDGCVPVPNRDPPPPPTPQQQSSASRGNANQVMSPSKRQQANLPPSPGQNGAGGVGGTHVYSPSNVRRPNESEIRKTPSKMSPRPPLPPTQTPPAKTPPRRKPVPGYESNTQPPTPETWHAMAEHARKSMPRSPQAPSPQAYEQQEEAPAGGYEEMSRGWHNDGRRLLAAGKYKDAIDMYTLAIYTRKRHGPWTTQQNARTLIEHARAQFATRDLVGASESLQDAVKILEELANDAMLLGETWSSLGSVLDRVGGKGEEAEQAHIAAMVVYGRANMSTEDKKWNKAWRNLCANLESRPGAHTPDEVWAVIEAGINDTGV